jgi:hypothetical protein
MAGEWRAILQIEIKAASGREAVLRHQAAGMPPVDAALGRGQDVAGSFAADLLAT